MFFLASSFADSSSDIAIINKHHIIYKAWCLSRKVSHIMGTWWFTAELWLFCRIIHALHSRICSYLDDVSSQCNMKSTSTCQPYRYSSNMYGVLWQIEIGQKGVVSKWTSHQERRETSKDAHQLWGFTKHRTRQTSPDSITNTKLWFIKIDVFHYFQRE